MYCNMAESGVLPPPFHSAPWKQNRRPPAKKKFFEPPNDATFAQIRKRLRRMTLNSEYRKGLEQFSASTNHQSPERVPLSPRVSSFTTRETHNHHLGDTLNNPTATKWRPASKYSFLSDDIEYRNVRRRLHSTPQNRFSDSDVSQASYSPETVITPRDDPELFASQIRLKDKPAERRNRSSSPKSKGSENSSGRVHLGLIDSLDLNEKLNDLDKIKERYSNDNFMHSLTLYKLRGHDKCFHPDTTHSNYIPRGTKLYHSGDKIGPSITPDSFSNSTMSLSSMFRETPNRGYPGAHGRESRKEQHKRRNQWRKAPADGENTDRENRKKRVGFDETPRPITEGLPFMSPLSLKEPKSILKKRDGSPSTTRSSKQYDLQSVMTDEEDEFLNNSQRNWSYHLPKIRSPPPAALRKPQTAFRQKMYHYGDGISHEFEAVIDRYGNCRQNSMVREQSVSSVASTRQIK